MSAARALRAALLVLGAVPLLTGAASILLGSAIIPGPDPSPSVESELRFYAAWWTGAGAVLLWVARPPQSAAAPCGRSAPCSSSAASPGWWLRPRPDGRDPTSWC